MSYAIKAIFLCLFFLLIIKRDAYAYTVVLDPGHGGAGSSHSGAVYMPYIEKDLNYAVAEQVYEELSNAGIDVYITREGDEDMGLEGRAIYAGYMGADLLISLHFNSSGPHDKYGCEVWTSLYDPYFSTGVALGNSILKELSSLGFAYKGVKTRTGSSGDYYGVIRHGVERGIPTVIVEHCFIDSFIDREILNTVGILGIAHADAEGIINYLESQGEELADLSRMHYTDGRDVYYERKKGNSNNVSSDDKEGYSVAKPISESRIASMDPDADVIDRDYVYRARYKSETHSVSESKVLSYEEQEGADR